MDRDKVRAVRTAYDRLAALGTAQFEIREMIERDPYPDVEHPSRRAYIFARKI